MLVRMQWQRTHFRPPILDSSTLHFVLLQPKSMGQDPRCWNHSGALILRIHFSALNEYHPSFQSFEAWTTLRKGLPPCVGYRSSYCPLPRFLPQVCNWFASKALWNQPERGGGSVCLWISCFPLCDSLSSGLQTSQLPTLSLNLKKRDWGETLPMGLFNSGAIIKGVPYS